MTQSQIVKTGRFSSFIILLVAAIWAPFILLLGDGLFIYFQDMASYFAPPISVIFLSAIFWKKANATAANTTLVGGLLIGILLRVGGTFVPEQIASIITPFLNRALINWLLCIVLMIIVTLLSERRITGPDEIIWKPSYAKLPGEVAKKHKGWQTFLIWWGIVILLRVIIYFIYA